MNRPDFAAARERLQGTAATALGLAVVVLAFVYLVPRQGDIAAAMNARRAEAVASAAIQPPAPAAVEPPSAPPTEPPTTAPGAAMPEQSAPEAPQKAAANPDEPPSTPPAADGTSQLLARPVVLDTATILIRQGKVRLAGIRAAPLSKKCGEDGPAGWYCGVEARTRFRSWLRARSISCDVPPGFGEKAEEREARCDLAGEDLGRWLVANGYAEAVAGGAYAASEAKAKDAKLGIWADKRPVD